MSDFVGMLLQAKIDPDAIQNIQKEINRISKNTDAIKIDIKVNNDALKDIKRLNKEIEGMVNKTSKTVDISGDFNKMKIHMNAAGDVKKVVTDITEEYGKQLQVIQSMDEKQRELVTTGQKLTIDKEKQLKADERIQNAIAKTIRLREEENRKLEERQAKASNKYLDNEYKLNQRIQERIELFKKEQEIKIKSAESRYGSLLDHNAIAKYRAELNKLSADMDNPERKIKEMRIELRGLESEAQNNKRALDLANKSAMSFGEALKTAAYKFGIWSAVTASYYKLIREIQNGIRFINEMDAALTEIGMVTNQTREQTAGLAQEYNKLAREMKVLTSEVTAGAVEFYRQGLSQEEVMERLRVNTMYSKIANIDFKESAELLTATVNSMGVEIERASDVFLYLGDSTATSGAEIAKGFQKTGGAAAALGLEFEKVSSWIATISAATREAAESIGSSINTILSRYSRLTETGFNEEDQTKINDVAKALGTINISIIDAQGNFKNFGDILDEVHTRWGSLNDETKAYIANSLAGTRQQSRFYNLMNNYTKSLDLYTESLEAAGTTQSKFQLYLESNQATIDEFKASLENLWITVIDSDSIMNLIKSLTSFVDVLNSVIDRFGALRSIALVVTPIIGIKYLKSITAATKATIAKELAMAGVTKSSIGLVGGFKLLIGQLLGVKTAADGATVSFMGLNAAAGIVGVALAAIPFILMKIAQKSRESKEAFNNALDNSQQINEEVKSLERLLKKQEELTKIENKSAEQKEELLKVQRELAQLYPELATGVDTEGNKIAENVKMTKQLTEEKRRLLEQELFAIKITAEKKLPQLKQELEEMRAEADEIQRRLATGDTFETKIYDGRKIQVDVTEKLKDRLLELVEAQRDNLEETNKLESGIRSHNEMVKEQIELEKWARTEELAAQATKARSISQMQEIEKELMQLGFTSEDVTNIISGNLDLVKEKYKELDMQQIINLQTIQELDATQKSAAINMLETSRQMTNQLIADTKARITAIQAEMNALIALTGGKAKQASVVSQKATHDDFIDAYKTSGILGAMSVTARDKSIDAQRELAELEGNLRAIDKALANVRSINVSKAGGIKSPKSKSSKSKKDEYRAEADRYARINLELDKNNILLQRNRIYQELADKDLKKRIELMDEEIKLNEQRQQQYHALNQERRKEVVELERSLSRYGFKFSGTGDNRMITNLENIKGKTKEVEEQFNRYIELQSNLIPQASQEWWNLQKTIESVRSDKLIAEFELADKKINELNKTLSELEYQFKLLDEKDISGKADNIARQIAILEYQVKLAKEELEAMGEVGEDALQAVKDRQDELNKRIQDGTLAIETMKRSLKDLRETARQEWIREKNTLAQAQQERLRALDQIQEKIVQIIRKRGEEEKKALDEAHKAEMDSLEKRHKERKQRYKDELDEYKKMIQDKIAALDEQWEEEDYLEELEKERQEAVRLQKEIDILSLDDSLTARNRVIELEEQLAKQKEKIAKMQQRRERNLLKKSLQDQLKDKEKDAKERENIADKLYENEKKRLEEEYRINKEFLERKYSDEKVYAEARESIMRGQVEVAEGVFMDIYDAFVDFENKFGKGMGILGDIIRDDFIRELEKAQDAIRQLDYLASNRLPTYDSDYQPRDDEWDYRDPPKYDYEEEYTRGKLSSMSRRDYERYVRYKELWELAKKQGDKVAMDAIHREAQAIRDKYGIKEDLYSYAQLKNLSYEEMKRRGYKHGGKITETGTIIAPFHGTKAKPEWIFNDAQLKSIIGDIVQSTLKLSIPKIPNPTTKSIANPYIFNLNVKGNLDKDILPDVKKMIDTSIKKAQEKQNRELNKRGVFSRPTY